MNDDTHTPHVFTVADLAAMLHCSDEVVRERAKTLGGLKFGRDWVFPAEAVIAALNRMSERAAERGAGSARADAPRGVGVVSVPSTRRGAPVRPDFDAWDVMRGASDQQGGRT